MANKSLTNDEYMQKIYNLYSGAFEVISEYKNKRSNVDIKHKCGYNFTAKAGWILSGKAKCPGCEKGAYLDTNAVKFRLSTLYNNDFELIGDYIDSKTPIKLRHKKCGTVSSHLFTNFERSARNCPNCSNLNKIKNIKCQKRIKEYELSKNCIASTHERIQDLLIDKNFGRTHTYGTKKKTNFRCPNCGNIIYTTPSLLFNKNDVLVCKNCGDGFSYPEKFVSNVFNDLGLNYIYQLSSRHFDWCLNYRYDYYIPCINSIVEVHGEQHYSDKNSFYNNNQQEIDDKKRSLALSNNISNYIIIDARHSSKDFIKESILSSFLNYYFDFSTVDWNKCAENACDSIVVKIWDDWNNGMVYVPDLALKYGVVTSTVYDYLEKGDECSKIHFDKKTYLEEEKSIHYRKISLKLSRPVKCIETGIYYKSSADAANDVGGKPSNITRACRGDRKTAYGFHWEYAA